MLKILSGNILYNTFSNEVSKFKVDVLLSTGMATLNEVLNSYKILDDKKFENIVYFKDIDNLIEKTIK